MNYQVHVVPPDTISKNYWFAIYRSLDSTLDVSKDQIIALHFGQDSFTCNDTYWDDEYRQGRYTYFATMLDRYWNESEVSNAVVGDSIPHYINPPDYAPENIMILGMDAHSLLIKCDPVEKADRYVAYISRDGSTFSDSAQASSNEILVDGLEESPQRRIGSQLRHYRPILQELFFESAQIVRFHVEPRPGFEPLRVHAVKQLWK